MSGSMSEDDLFKALLKKKPEERKPIAKPPQRTAPVAPPIPPIEIQEKVIETPQVKPQETEVVVEAIKNLNASVNMIHGLVKTVIVPVLVLILIVGIAILVKT